MNAAPKKPRPKRDRPNDSELKAAKAEPKIDFEKALAALQEVVQQLEQGDLGLSESLEKYEHGVKFLNQCYRQLEAAEQRVDLLKRLDEQGRAVTESFAEDEMSLEEKAASRGARRTAKPNKTSKPPSQESGVDGSTGLF